MGERAGSEAGRGAPVMHDTDLSTQPRTRRNLLAVAGAGAAAAIATLMSGRRVQAGHEGVADVLHLEQENNAGAQTSLESTASSPTITLRNTGDGNALELESSGQVMVARLLGNSVNHTVQIEHEESVDGAALFAIGLGTGVEAESTGEGAGVWGRSASGPGVTGESTSGPGVQGSSANGPGVVGDGSGEHPGVEGHGQGGPGGSFHSEAAAGLTATSLNASAVAGFSENGRGGSFGSQSGIGARGFSDGGDGVQGTSESGAGVNGHSHSGAGGTFDTEEGDFAVHIGGNAA